MAPHLGSCVANCSPDSCARHASNAPPEASPAPVNFSHGFGRRRARGMTLAKTTIVAAQTRQVMDDQTHFIHGRLAESCASTSANPDLLRYRIGAARLLP